MKFLLNVGAEKAGTTWLHNYFRYHNDYHDIGKELNIIQRDDLVPVFRTYAPGRDDLKQYFQFLVDTIKKHGVTGDFTHYEGSTANIFRLFKDGLESHGITVVPVYIMRDPIERAWSAWNMLGGGSTDMPAPARFLARSYFDCKYEETIQALDNVFGNTLYFFYEEFFTQSNIDTICDALSIKRIPAQLSHAINQGNYSRDIPQSFIDSFGNTQKSRNAIKFIQKRFDRDPPWNLQNYT